MRISVVVPVYNGEESLAELLERLHAVLATAVDDYEVILVDDGSADGSWARILELREASDKVRGMTMMRNFGQHNALLAGIRAARHEVIVTMDDDLQHRPEEIPALLAGLDGADLVYGKAVEEEHGFLRSLSSRLVKASLAISLGVGSARSISAFRAFRTPLREVFNSNDAFVSLDVLLSWATTRVHEVAVPMDERRFGSSAYTFRKLVRHSLNMVTGYSALPLRLVSYLGFAFAVMGFGLFLFVILRWMFSGSPVAGFTFLAAMTASFSGATMLAIGVLGEYVGRMHFRSMQRPMFLVRETTDADRVVDAE
jgi:undecaprenyl-phosphate 4-deoxy-4-formamido-L-arabinose transferase